MKRYIWLLISALLTASANALVQQRNVSGFSVAEEYESLAARHAHNPDNPEILQRLISLEFQFNYYEKALANARKLKALGRKTGNERAYLVGMVYLGQSFLCLREKDSMEYYIGKSLALGKKLKDRWALATLYNAMAIYAMYVEMDYYKAIEQLHKGLEYIELNKDDTRNFTLLGNLALAYYFRKDPAGLPYALQVYEIGNSYGDSYMVFTGAMISAYMYCMLEDYRTALGFIREAVPLTNLYGNHTDIYTLYGEITIALGDERQGVAYFDKALEYAVGGSLYPGTDIYLSYGKYLMDKSRYAEAVPYFKKGIDVSLRDSYSMNRYLLYRHLSESYEMLGNSREALAYHKLFHAESDSIFNVMRERSLTEMRIRYETEKSEKELQQHKLELLKEQKRFQVIIFVLLLICTVTAATYILYYRNNKKYRQLLRQHREMVTRERWYEEQIKRFSVEPQVPEKHVISNAKTEELFKRLQKLMYEDRIYRMKDLSRDKVSAMLSTNRTYLTQVIQECTGLSFIYYVNSFRIDEAVRILSDSSNDIPLKALASDVGFNTIATFYRFFQAATGLSPSKFREKAAG